ncbi:MAG: porin family protein [Flavobacteriaceae bacterium]
MKMRIVYFLLCWYGVIFSQDLPKDTNQITDVKYREDQFYAGVTYNFLENKPSGMSQQGLSGGLHLGFIRDFPINKKRNIAFGVGIGYSSNSYNHNLYLREEGGEVTYQILDNNEVSYQKNKLNMHVLEMPIQFRWRTSTAESYKFWRIYTGVKIGYVVNSIVKYKGGLGDFKQNNTPHLNRLKTTADISFGWNTWNFHIAYGLNKLFNDDAKMNGQAIDITEIKFGLMFYMF